MYTIRKCRGASLIRGIRDRDCRSYDHLADFEEMEVVVSQWLPDLPLSSPPITSIKSGISRLLVSRGWPDLLNGNDRSFILRSYPVIFHSCLVIDTLVNFGLYFLLVVYRCHILAYLSGRVHLDLNA